MVGREKQAKNGRKIPLFNINLTPQNILNN
jgi:hypothetical protein